MGKVLVLSPHPDDEAIGCGGTLRRHAESGDEVFVIFLTSGERGSKTMRPAETAAVREREADLAAQILGVSKLDFWRAPDGALRCSADLAQRLTTVLREFEPDYIYTPNIGEAHPDHRAAMRLTLRSLRESQVRWPVLRLYEIWTPLQRFDVMQDISAFVDAKRQAVQCYASQLANLRFDEAALALNRYRGAMHNAGGGEFAEAFVELKQPVIRRGSIVPAQAVEMSSKVVEAPLTGVEHDAEPGVCKP